MASGGRWRDRRSWCCDYFGYISGISRAYLVYISCTSRVYLGYISGVSRAYLGCISGASRAHLGYISQGEGFVIHHFAGEVAYDVDGFVDKNRDALPGELSLLLSGSEVCVLLTSNM